MNSLFKVITSIVLTDVDHNDLTPPNILITGSVILDVKSADAATEIVTTEDITFADWATSTPGSIKITSVIKSTDHTTFASISPAVTDPDLDVATTVTETTEGDKYVLTVVSDVTYTVAPLYLFAETVNQTSIENAEPKIYRYLILDHSLVDGLLHGNPGGDYYMTCQEMYSIMNVACVKLSEGMYQTLRQSWKQEKIIEIDENTANYGTVFFGEIRPVAKMWEAKSAHYGEKVPTEITPEIIVCILTVMKAFAKEIVESEFERRYLEMRNASMIEADSWHLQLMEAREWLTYQGADGHRTPFLDYLAAHKKVDKTTLSNKILEKAEAYQDKFSTLLVQMQTILDKFDECSSVWDINILYEDYFGISMPIKQAVALGRTLSDDDYTRKPEWAVKGNGHYF